MLKWCPCLGWCLTDPASGGEAKVLLNPITPTYNVRRISSFGQTVINDAGEEEEVARHGTLPTNIVNGLPPWSTNPIPIQPGVTKAEVTGRIHRLASIPESSPKVRHLLNKSLSYTDQNRCDMSPVRTRKKIPTPEEFAQVNYYHDNEGDTYSINSEISRKSEDKTDTAYNYDSVDDNNLSEEEKSIERLGKSVSIQPSLVKPTKNLDTSEKPKSPWLKVKNTVTKQKSPFLKMKSVMDKSYGNVDSECEGVNAEKVGKAIDPSDLNGSKKDVPSLYGCEYEDSMSHTASQDTDIIGDEEIYEAILEGNKPSDSAEVAKQYGLDINMYNSSSSLGLGLGSSDEDLSANISIAKLIFSTRLDKDSNQLHVNIDRVEGLGGQGPTNQEFDVILKLGFLKGGHTYSTKTNKSSKSINQTFSLHVKDISTCVLRLSVYNSDWQATHDALGYSLLRISNCSQSTTQHILNISPRSTISDSVGLVEVSFHVRSNMLNVIVHKIFDILPSFRCHRMYIKVSMYVSSKKAKEKISKTEGADKGYVMFDFESKFKAQLLTEQHSFVMISLKKKGENTKLFKNDKTLGRIFLGPLFYNGNKINYWGEAILEEKIITRTFSLYL